VIGLLVLAPVIALCVAAVRLTSPGPIIFRQSRIGRNQEPFLMLKFRTMYADADDRVHREQAMREMRGDGAGDGRCAFKDERDPRITPVGRFLRRYSLDEIPQLVNVLRGDMALVGPRPSLPYEAELFPSWANERYQCRPGMTGLWQVSGRSHLSLVEMLELDCRYVREWGLRSDLNILVRTPQAVLEGAA
jgi:lipopolysaccharide/colanic/teichoic acid biosynthesis glycosyltransferase